MVRGAEKLVVDMELAKERFARKTSEKRQVKVNEQQILHIKNCKGNAGFRYQGFF